MKKFKQKFSQSFFLKNFFSKSEKSIFFLKNFFLIFLYQIFNSFFFKKQFFLIFFKNVFLFSKPHFFSIKAFPKKKKIFQAKKFYFD